MRWDLFCRVVDNFGDIGVCWRLARQLAERGQSVRLCVDDDSALRWMAPAAAQGVRVVPWPAGDELVDPGEVVIEAFGCDPPPAFVRRMLQRHPPPVWINLEYLSAQDYVERCHGLQSPQLAGPGRGAVKRFFYPGFGERSGGLLREPDLPAARAAFDADAWLSASGLPAQPGERRISLFCYDGAPVWRLLPMLGDRPTLLLLTPGAAQRLVGRWRTSLPTTVRCVELPWLSQTDYDRVLWSCELNFVRGEDSLVRAIWAGAPFVWQIYPQHDGVHADKLDAFLRRHLAAAERATAAPIAAFFRAWNGLGGTDVPLPALPPWHEHARRWRDDLQRQTDLCTRLLAFVDGHRAGGPAATAAT